MADLQRRNAGDSIIITGRQPAYDMPITGKDIFNGAAPDWSDPANITAALARKRYVFIRNTLDPTAAEAVSESIPGDNSQPDSIITSRSGAGEWEFEVLPEDAINLLQGWFNTPTPANTELANQNIASKFAFSDSKIAPVDAEDNPTAKWPGQLAFTPADGTVESIQINGQQRRSRTNRYNSQTFETVRPNDAGLFLSNKFYYQINEVVMNGKAATGADALEFRPDTKTAELTLATIESIFPGWVVQMIKAKLPYIAYNVIPNEFEFQIRQGALRLVLRVIASFVQEGRTLTNPIARAYELPLMNTETPTPRAILDVYDYDNLNFFPGYGTALAIGAVGESLADLKTKVDAGTAHITPITELTIAGSHNYDTEGGFTGDPVSGQPSTAEGQTRTVSVNANIEHQTDTSAADNQTAFWQDRYFEGQRVPIIIQNYNWDNLGRQTVIESQFPDCKLSEVPNLPIEGAGQQNRRLAFAARPKGADGAIKMIFHSKNGFAE